MFWTIYRPSSSGKEGGRAEETTISFDPVDRAIVDLHRNRIIRYQVFTWRRIPYRKRNGSEPINLIC
jgi:hypothetical protein